MEKNDKYKQKGKVLNGMSLEEANTLEEQMRLVGNN